MNDKTKFTKFESFWLGTLDATSIGKHLRVSHHEIMSKLCIK